MGDIPPMNDWEILDIETEAGPRGCDAFGRADILQLIARVRVEQARVVELTKERGAARASNAILRCQVDEGDVARANLDDARNERDAALVRVRELESERNDALARVAELESWEDANDEWSERISAAFPTRSGSHDEYGTAMRMVGARRDMSALVALVNWLLVERDEAVRKVAELEAMTPSQRTIRAIAKAQAAAAKHERERAEAQVSALRADLARAVNSLELDDETYQVKLATELRAKWGLT